MGSMKRHIQEYFWEKVLYDVRNQMSSCKTWDLVNLKVLNSVEIQAEIEVEHQVTDVFFYLIRDEFKF